MTQLRQRMLEAITKHVGASDLHGYEIEPSGQDKAAEKCEAIFHHEMELFAEWLGEKNWSKLSNGSFFSTSIKYAGKTLTTKELVQQFKKDKGL